MIDLGYRATIRKAFEAALVNRTIAGDKISAPIDRRLVPEDFPFLLVYTMESKALPETYGDATITRVVSVAVEYGVMSTVSAWRDDVDAFSEVVEDLIDADRTLGGKVNHTTWVQTLADVSSEGEFLYGVGLAEFQVEILTERHVPDFEGEIPARVFARPEVVPANALPMRREPAEVSGVWHNQDPIGERAAWGGDTGLPGLPVEPPAPEIPEA